MFLVFLGPLARPVAADPVEVITSADPTCVEVIVYVGDPAPSTRWCV
jgi:hypothetical protein